MSERSAEDVLTSFSFWNGGGDGSAHLSPRHVADILRQRGVGQKYLLAKDVFNESGTLTHVAGILQRILDVILAEHKKASAPSEIDKHVEWFKHWSERVERLRQSIEREQKRIAKFAPPSKRGRCIYVLDVNRAGGCGSWEYRHDSSFRDNWDEARDQLDELRAIRSIDDIANCMGVGAKTMERLRG